MLSASHHLHIKSIVESSSHYHTTLSPRSEKWYIGSLVQVRNLNGYPDRQVEYQHSEQSSFLHSRPVTIFRAHNNKPSKIAFLFVFLFPFR